MKHLNDFNKFNKLNENFEWSNPYHTGQYINIEIKPNSLEITLNKDGKELLEDKVEYDVDNDEKIDEEIFWIMFEDIQVNSEFEFIHDLGNAGFGLTEAPGIIHGYGMDDDGNYIENPDSRLFYYDKYMLKNFVYELYKEGSVVFDEQK